MQKHDQHFAKGLSYQKAAFDSIFSIISITQDSSNKIIEQNLGQFSWIPETSRKSLLDFSSICQKSTTDLKSKIDQGFEILEAQFTAPGSKGSAQPSPSAPQPAKKTSPATKAPVKKKATPAKAKPATKPAAKKTVARAAKKATPATGAKTAQPAQAKKTTAAKVTTPAQSTANKPVAAAPAAKPVTAATTKKPVKTVADPPKPEKK